MTKGRRASTNCCTRRCTSSSSNVPCSSQGSVFIFYACCRFLATAYDKIINEYLSICAGFSAGRVGAQEWLSWTKLLGTFSVVFADTQISIYTIDQGYTLCRHYRHIICCSKYLLLLGLRARYSHLVRVADRQLKAALCRHAPCTAPRFQQLPARPAPAPLLCSSKVTTGAWYPSRGQGDPARYYL